MRVTFNIIDPNSGKHTYTYKEKKQSRMLVKHNIEKSGIVKNFLLRCITLNKATRM